MRPWALYPPVARGYPVAMKALEPDRVHIASRLGNGPLAEPAARGREWDAARQVGFLPANELGRRQIAYLEQRIRFFHLANACYKMNI